MPIKVKICGIKSLQEALWAISSGADALGFVFAPNSKRYINPKDAQNIINQLPPFISKVGVFVKETPETVAQIVSQCLLDTIQLHGGENLEQYAHIPVHKVKVISLAVDRKNDTHLQQLAQLKNYSQLSYSILLDTTVQKLSGGTGIPLPWKDPHFQEFLQKVKETDRPFILAGGLNPENIKDAISYTSPYAVDVSSGVERKGRKDPHLIRQFIKKAKERSITYDPY